MSVESGRAPEPVGPYPHARWAGDFLYVSGVGPPQRGTSVIPGVELDEAGRVVAADIRAQCESCFANVKAVVKDAGAEWSDVFDVLAFLTHMDRDFAGYNEVYAKWFAGPDGPRPTRTTVEIGALPTPIAVELKLVCYRPGGPIKTARTGEAS